MKKVFASLLTLAMVTGLAACSTPAATTTAGTTAAGTTVAATTTAGTTTAGTTAAGTTTAGTTAAGTTTAGNAKDVKIGFIALHDNNSGSDSAHIEGVTKAAEVLGIDPKPPIIFKDNVPGDETAYATPVDLA